MEPRIVAESAAIHHGWIKKLDENLSGDIGVAQLLRNNLSADTKICTISCSVNAPLDFSHQHKQAADLFVCFDCCALKLPI